MILEAIVSIFLLSTEPHPLSFQEFHKWQPDQEVVIRGFLYNKEDQWILADQPNLKSCCVATLDNQIYLSESLEVASLDNAITVQGRLKVDSNNLYHLENVKILNDKRSWPIFSILLLSLTLIGVVAICKRKRAQTKSAKS